MNVTVRIPTQLRALTDGRQEVDAAGATVADVIADLEGRHPGIGVRLLDESGELRRFVNIYLDQEDIRFLDGLGSEVRKGAELSIIPAIAGG